MGSRRTTAVLLAAVLCVPVWLAGTFTVDVRPAGAASPVTLVPLPSGGLNTYTNEALTIGPDGNVWYALTSSPLAGFIGSVTPAGGVTEYRLPTGATPVSIASGADGKLWYTDNGRNLVGKITTAGVRTEYTLPTGNTPGQIARGGDGNLWFANWDADSPTWHGIGRITTAGVVTFFGTGYVGVAIASASDGGLWYCGTPRIGTDQLLHIATNGSETAITTMTQACSGIADAGGGAVWFVDGGMVYRRAANGTVSQVPAAPAPYAVAGGSIASQPDGTLWVDARASLEMPPEPSGLLRIGADLVPGVITIANFQRVQDWSTRVTGVVAGSNLIAFGRNDNAIGLLPLGAKTLTTTSLTVPAVPVPVGQATTLTASVSAVGGTGTPTGGVSFFVQDSGQFRLLGSAPVVRGHATLTLGPTQLVGDGSFFAAADYGGDANHVGSQSLALEFSIAPRYSSFTLLQIPTAGPRFVCMDPTPDCVLLPRGQAVVLDAIVFPDRAAPVAPPGIWPTGSVRFITVMGTILGSAPLVNGIARFEAAPLATRTQINAWYDGDNSFVRGGDGLWVTPVPAPSPPQWHFEAVDGPGRSTGGITGNVGAGASSVVFGGVPHVFSYDATHGDLRHAWLAGGWHAETLDGASTGPVGRINANVGQDTTALVSGGRLHVFFYDATNGALRHGWWSGTHWSFETLDGTATALARGHTANNVGLFATATTYGTGIHVYYYDRTRGDLRHVRWTGTGWTTETLDGNATDLSGRVNRDVGRDISVVLYGGAPHLWYRDATNGDLRHGWRVGSAWHFETLDGNANSSTTGSVNSDLGSFTAVALFGGAPHVWYYDHGGGALRHAWWTGWAWHFEDLDGWGGWAGEVFANVGADATATLLGGLPHVWYRDATNGDLRHGWWNGSRWNFEALDGFAGTSGRRTGDLGYDTTVLLIAGLPHLWYYDLTRGDLRHAWVA